MMLLNSQCIKNFKSDQGVVLPILALVSGVVVFLLLFLAIASVQVDRAGRKLRIISDEVCRVVAQEQVGSHREAAQLFRGLVNNLLSGNRLSGITLTRADLIMPTMPQQADFPAVPLNSVCPQGTPTGPHPPITTSPFGPTPFGQIFGQNGSCNLSAGEGDCRFHHDMDPLIDPNSATRRYPPNITNNLEGPGSFVACELDGEVDTLVPYYDSLQRRFLRKRPVRSKSAWWMPVRAPLPALGSTAPPAGLTVAVLPQLTVNPADPRFQIPASVGNNYRPLRGVWPAVNPINAFNPGTVDHRYPVQGNLNLWIPDWWLMPDERRDYVNGLIPVTRYTPGDISGVTGEQQQILNSALNMPVLIRNIFLSTIVELASRHGQLRNMTEVLIANPYHRSFQSNVNRTSLHPFENYPVEVVRFCEDLRFPQFGLPYVFYHGGNPGNIPTNGNPGVFGDPLGTGTEFMQGFVFPFAGRFGTATEIPEPFRYSNASEEKEYRQFHLLLASQLRFPYHIYYGGSGVSRYPNIGVQNIRFEPSFLSGTLPVGYNFLSELINGQNTGNLDQTFPWNITRGPGERPCDNTGSGVTRCLNGPELVSALGSVQRCPVLVGASNPYFRCEPVTLPNARLGSDVAGMPRELRGDLRALLRALDYRTGGNIAGARLRRPGLFLPDIQLGVIPRALVNNRLPFGADKYWNVPRVNSHVLIVLHQRIPGTPATGSNSGNGEAGIVSQLVDQVNQMGRPVTVAYFPTNDRDANQTEIQRLKSIFRDTSQNPNATAPTFNKVFVFYPDNPIYQNRYQAGPGQPESSKYMRYWRDVMSQGQQVYIVSTARRIFYERILRLELKL